MKSSYLFFYVLLIPTFFAFGCKKSDEQTSPAYQGKAYSVDLVKGNDTTTTSKMPFKTLSKAISFVNSGDTILLKNGNYGDVVLGRTPGLDWGSDPSEITRPYSKFTNWVTIKAAPGQTPHFNSLSIGTLNIPNSGSPSKRINFSQEGNCNLYIRIEGITIDDGISIYGSRFVNINNCTINRIGDLNGSVSNIDNKAGILIENGRYITIENNEITHVSIGIIAGSYDLTIRNNNIHDNSHDGIRVGGGDNWLIEGNKLHDFDDGVDDNSGYDWNRHCDGIQIFTLFDVTNNLTIRGNIFYHLEAMGIMVNASTVNTSYYQKWIIENNIFGPVGGTTISFGGDVRNGCVFRHNTVVYAPNDAWQSIYRPMNGQQYKVAMWFANYAYNGFRYYNNIFTNESKVPYDYDFTAGNIYYDYKSDSPYEPIPGNIADYIASGKIPGTLTANSAAIDAGSAKYASELKFDFLGNPRDSKPDVGALEKQK